VLESASILKLLNIKLINIRIQIDSNGNKYVTMFCIMETRRRSSYFWIPNFLTLLIALFETCRKTPKLFKDELEFRQLYSDILKIDRLFHVEIEEGGTTCRLGTLSNAISSML